MESIRKVLSVHDNGWWNAIQRNKGTIYVYTVVLLISLVPIILFPTFRSRQNITNIFSQVAPLGFVALGQTLAILTTGIDLSVGAIMSLTTVLMATYVGTGGIGSTLQAIGLVFGAATLVGIVNGILVSKLDLEPLIATLATGSIVSGITLSIMSQPGGYVPRSVNQLWLHEVGGFVPLAFIYFLVVAGLCYWFLRYTALGRKIYAIGGDEDKARIAGINIDKVQLAVYIGSALLAALSGLALAARIRSGDPLAGDPFTFNSIAAVLIGGTTFKGGVGGVVRTIAGVLIFSLLSLILNFSGISPFYQNILSGTVVTVAVIYSSFGG